jgi:hypothetical protein
MLFVVSAVIIAASAATKLYRMQMPLVPADIIILLTPQKNVPKMIHLSSYLFLKSIVSNKKCCPTFYFGEAIVRLLYARIDIEVQNKHMPPPKYFIWGSH